jgi:hypothetical protein
MSQPIGGVSGVARRAPGGPPKAEPGVRRAGLPRQSPALTPGQRRRRRRLNLDAGTLAIDVTRVVVDGQVIESDGKTENAQHLLALDPLTLAV